MCVCVCVCVCIYIYIYIYINSHVRTCQMFGNIISAFAKINVWSVGGNVVRRINFRTRETRSDGMAVGCHKMIHNLRHFGLPPRVLFRSLLFSDVTERRLVLVTDASGHPVGRIFKGQTAFIG